MDPNVSRDAARLGTTKIDKSLSASTQDDRVAVLSSLVDMALGSRDAKTEAEALQMNFLAHKP